MKKHLQLSSRQDRIINLVVGGFTSVVVLVSTHFRCLGVDHPVWGRAAQPGPAGNHSRGSSSQTKTAVTSGMINKEVSPNKQLVFSLLLYYTSICSRGQICLICNTASEPTLLQKALSWAFFELGHIFLRVDKTEEESYLKSCHVSSSR